MRDFDFLQPTSVAEASRMLADLGEDCRIMAGGTALMLVMRQRILNPSHIISVQKIAQLQGIHRDAQGVLHIGALTRHTDLAQSELVQKHLPMLARMAAQVANPQVRNQGTLGGNLCYGDPSTDPPGCLMALGAQVVLGSTRGQRILEMEDFLLDYFSTAIESDELVTEVRIPPLPHHAVAHYTRYKRTAAEHRPLVNVSAVIQMHDSLCRHARLVVGASVAVPRRLKAVEQFLEGRSLSEAVTREAADLVARTINPISDLRGSADYRREMIRVHVNRTLQALNSQSQSPKDHT